MRSKNVTQAVEAFNKFEKAQKRWLESFDNLSEEEEAELERRLFTQGVTFARAKA